MGFEGTLIEVVEIFQKCFWIPYQIGDRMRYLLNTSDQKRGAWHTLVPHYLPPILSPAILPLRHQWTTIRTPSSATTPPSLLYQLSYQYPLHQEQYPYPCQKLHQEEYTILYNSNISSSFNHLSLINYNNHHLNLLFKNSITYPINHFRSSIFSTFLLRLL